MLPHSLESTDVYIYGRQWRWSPIVMVGSDSLRNGSPRQPLSTSSGRYQCTHLGMIGWYGIANSSRTCSQTHHHAQYMTSYRVLLFSQDLRCYNDAMLSTPTCHVAGLPELLFPSFAVPAVIYFCRWAM